MQTKRWSRTLSAVVMLLLLFAAGSLLAQTSTKRKVSIEILPPTRPLRFGRIYGMMLLHVKVTNITTEPLRYVPCVGAGLECAGFETELMITSPLQGVQSQFVVR